MKTTIRLFILLLFMGHVTLAQKSMSSISSGRTSINESSDNTTREDKTREKMASGFKIPEYFDCSQDPIACIDCVDKKRAAFRDSTYKILARLTLSCARENCGNNATTCFDGNCSGDKIYRSKCYKCVDPWDIWYRNILSEIDSTYKRSMRRCVVASQKTSIIQKTDEVNDVNIYPNPANKEFNLEITLSEDRQMNMIVTNNIGQQVMEINKFYTTGTTKEKIDIEKLSGGIYFIMLNIGDYKSVQKLIVTEK